MKRRVGWTGRWLAPLVLATFCGVPADEAAVGGMRVGFGRVDITPDYPVRLSGFGFRRAESEGVTQRIWAKAMAVDDGVSGPAVVVAVDNLGVPAWMTSEVARRLEAAGRVAAARLAITATHTHTAPMLTGVAPTLFGEPVPTAHQHAIDRYTRELTDAIESAAVAAVEGLRPARLEWGIGRAGFAMNRRTGGGPVDHDLPLLVARDPEGGRVFGVWFSYACHCVTLSHNHVGGDWAGWAQSELEDALPGATVLASIGCGADQNPDSGVTGDKVDVARRQGREIADEAVRLAGTALTEVEGPVGVALRGIRLAFDEPPSLEEWKERAGRGDAVGHHARVNLARLERGETLPDAIDYPIQTWTFGDDLAMVFLPGEVVVDYALRIKREFDRNRIWINAYANDAPCYIPSERILREGGYEGGGAMIYYDRPTRFAPGLEQRILDVLHGLIPEAYRSPEGTDGTAPLSPEASLRTIRTRPELEVELVVAEPLVVDPVAIDWDASGRLWVAEMHDYPLGLEGRYDAGGRIRVLEDGDGDGRYDRGTVFLEGVAFPTGLTVWGDGVLIGAAPDILYAEDTDGDGRADRVDTWFTGFATGNYQARVNSLALGLDNRLHGANGLIGGVIRTGDGGGGVDIRGRDFRFDPVTRELETVAGLTQQGRVRDDRGDWFGCHNGALILHFPFDERDAIRNPHLPAPAASTFHWDDADPNRLFPISPALERFNDPGHQNRVTSACGLGIYRDEALGVGFQGNAFTCEPVHNVVRRTVMRRSGSTFAGRRAEGEEDREFLASSDPWFRPVQVRTGPDGALWVVDMYRFLMEHPIWIRPDRLADLDPRAGDRQGRIYRVFPKGARPAAFEGWPAGGVVADWVAALESANGTVRDLAHQRLLLSGDRTCLPALREMATHGMRGNARLHALSLLSGFGAVEDLLLEKVLGDSDPGVRRLAVRLAEGRLGEAPGVTSGVISRLDDADAGVRLAAARALGGWDDVRSGEALAGYLIRRGGDPYAAAAAWGGLVGNLGGVARRILEARDEGGADLAVARAQWAALVRTAAGVGDRGVLEDLLEHAPGAGSEDGVEGWRELAELVEACERAGWDPFAGESEAAGRLREACATARDLAADPARPVELRCEAMRLLGRELEWAARDRAILRDGLRSGNDRLVDAALRVAGRGLGDAGGAAELLSDWDGYSPAVQRRVLDVMLQREAGRRAVVAKAAADAEFRAGVPWTRWEALAVGDDEVIREAAATFLESVRPAARGSVLHEYEPATGLAGDRESGKALFGERCASCHRLEGIGTVVGPDLLELSDRSPAALLPGILDPNRAVLERYLAYAVTLRDGRVLAGILVNETAAGFTVTDASGRSEAVLRADVESIRSTGRSLMPEGLEAGLSVGAMADLLAFVGSARGEGEPPPRDPRVIADYLLDDGRPVAEREAGVRVHYMLAPALVREMTRDLAVGTAEEYRRIPWIWRVAIGAGRGGDPGILLGLLDLSLPGEGEPLRDWQAVVIGGGLINGLGQTGLWPGERLRDLAAGDAKLARRLEGVAGDVRRMAADARVPDGTRYDALRMVVLESDPAGAVAFLEGYLGAGISAELQMGAVSALVDLPGGESTRVLRGALGGLTESNRRLAEEGLERRTASE